MSQKARLWLKGWQVSLVALALVLVSLIAWRLSEGKPVLNFADCSAVGQLTDDYPQRCVAPDGRLFTADAARVTPTSVGESVPFDMLVGSGGPYPDKITQIARTSSQWQKLWSLLFTGLNPIPPLPSVDFARNMVVVVAGGRQATTGHRMQVVSLTKSGNTLTVHANIISPDKKCRTSSIPSSVGNYYAIATTAKFDGQVSFDIQEQIAAC